MSEKITKAASSSALSSGNLDGKLSIDARELGARRWPSIGWRAGTGWILVVVSVSGAECRAYGATAGREKPPDRSSG